MRNMNADHYVQTLAKEQDRKYAFKAKDKLAMEDWQSCFRQDLIKALGIDKIRARGICDLKPVCLGTVQMKDHIREEWGITSEPGYQIPFYLLRPLQQIGPLPLVITPHGHGKYGKDTYAGIAHNDEDRKEMEEGERDIALQAVRQGYIAIALDQRGFAGTKLQRDIEADANNSCRTMQMHALLFGRTLVGERVWDISRLIDYAKTRPEIDDKRIVVTGNSGGGTATLFSSVIETRISISIPGSYFCTFEHSIGSIYHCECNYVPGIMTLGEMYDVAGLIAPRPLLVVAGSEDPIFPIDAVRTAFNKVQEIYKVAGVPNGCELYVGHGGHRYYKARVWSFVKEWLR